MLGPTVGTAAVRVGRDKRPLNGMIVGSPGTISSFRGKRAIIYYPKTSQFVLSD
ncbi:hypothetical protein F9C07_7120 [Aspergillus flavus]|uniref:Uncharacterized protein n=1 Tax=Aspergillus flavus (strain ATCC 200026 / FGSC A1120 / IAM 13836 / NRRL 3357 / JCM 12722 / SRRC 167) TaxID=332952 RepID=A0A7U2MM64_ASPFN|nr:hypothetical protein F9C07_7120 [Aspergillus flavus]